MASVTKFYPCGSPAPYSPATYRGSWDVLPTVSTRTLADDKTGDKVRILGKTQTAPSAPYNIGVARFVSNPLDAQTISGTLDMALNVQENNADANYFTKVYLYVLAGDTDVVRGVLLDFADTGGTEWVTTSFGQVFAFSTPQALSSVAAQAGDRLVLEFGVRMIAGATAISRSANIWCGATNRFFDGTILADAVVGATGTGVTAAGFFEFSSAITVQRVSAATGDLLVGNRELYLYDGTTGALKRRILPIGSQDPAGGAQAVANGNIYVSYESLNAGDDPLNGQIAIYDPVTLAFSSLFQTTPGIGPHALSPTGDGKLLSGFIGDGVGATSCGEDNVSEAAYPKTTGTTNTYSATYPARTVAPPSTQTFTLVSSVGYDREYRMTVTVAATFANNAGAQPEFSIGRTGSISSHFPSSTFTDEVLGTVHLLSGTIPAGEDLIVTEVEATDFTATGSLTVSVTAVFPVAQVLVASSFAGDRLVEIVVEVDETFADGDGQQPEFQVGITGDADLFAGSAVFTDQVVGARVTYSGTLPAGDELLVTAQRAIGTTSTGALRVQVTAIGVSTADAMAVRRYASDGTLEATFAVAPELGGSNAIDLASDLRTLYYTSLGRAIKRYDIVDDAQSGDFAILPPATNGEIARGLRILPDGTVLVVDAVDIKRLSVAGAIIQTYEIADQFDWGTIALSVDGTYFYVANRADGAVCPPMIAKIRVSDGAVVFTITGDANVPDTGGGMCSGGVTVIGGYRAALNTPTPGGDILYPTDDNTATGGSIATEERLIRWERIGPRIEAERGVLKHRWFELHAQVGVGLATGQGRVPIVNLSWSDDAGRTWSNEHPLSMGVMGDYKKLLRWRRLGPSRGRNYRVSGSDPVMVALIAAYLGLEKGTTPT